MSDTDIYKNREPIKQATSADPRYRKGRRRRSASYRVFDDKDRKRRSKNTGLRRLLHLSRKSENDKPIWIGMLVVVVVLLVGIALWQFWYIELAARRQSRANEHYVPTPSSDSTQPVHSAAE